MSKIGVTSATICARADLRAIVDATFGGDHDVTYLPAGTADLPTFLADKDAALIGRELVAEDLLGRAPKLKAISVYGVGFDNVDMAACRSRSVAVLVAPGVNADAVAEHTIGLMLAVMRNIAANDRHIHDGRWNKDGGRTLTGKTVAIIGAGAVGTRVGRLLRAFSCQVVLNDILAKADLAKELGGCELGFEAALQHADIVTAHVPLTVATRGMFGREAFQIMKPGGVLINTSRGAVVSQKALKDALRAGQLKGAGLDVFENEPIVDTELFSLPGVVGTPHTAGNAQEAVEAMTRAAAGKLLDFLKGNE